MRPRLRVHRLPRRTLRRWLVVAVCVAVAAAGVVIGFRVAGGGASGFRTASVTMRSVEGTLTLGATVTPLDRVTLLFGVSGTVATVPVKVGEHVTAGETLATLAPTTLAKQVTQAEASVRAAESALSADEAAQASASGPGTHGGTSSGTTGSHGGQGSTSPGTLAGDQHVLLQAQQAADAQQQATDAAVAAVTAACGGTTGGKTKGGTTGGKTKGGTTGSTGGTARAARTSGNAMSAATTGARGATPSSACQGALSTALTAEQTLSADLGAVSKAEDALAALLSSGDVGPGTTPGTTTSAAPATATSPGRTHSPHGATRQGTTTGASTTTRTTANSKAAQLATDQATIDSDKVTLIEAQQSLAEAQLVTPIGGTVAAVNLKAGTQVSAGAPTQEITVLSQDSFDVFGSLTTAQAAQVAVGDRATVTVDGRTGSLDGSVVRVGPVDTAAGDSYPLVVALPQGAAGLYTGSNAQLSVVLRRAHRVLVAPTSAVHTEHGHSFVMSLAGGRPVRHEVTVGIVSALFTQLRSGVHRGETLVEAVLTRPVPNPSGTLQRRSGNGPPRFFVHPGIFVGPGHGFFAPGAGG